MRPTLIFAAVFLAACSRAENPGHPVDSANGSPGQVGSLGGASHGALDSAGNPERACGVSGMALLTDQGIGELREGRLVSEVRELCAVISDSQQLGAEGMTERVLVISIEGELIRAVVNNERIWRIEVSSPEFKTSDSLGVDSQLRRIARKRGARFFPGEGGVYGFLPDHCGLSFRFSVPLRPPKRGNWTAESIDAAHGDAAVDRVLVTKCTR